MLSRIQLFAQVFLLVSMIYISLDGDIRYRQYMERAVKEVSTACLTSDDLQKYWPLTIDGDPTGINSTIEACLRTSTHSIVWPAPGQHPSEGCWIFQKCVAHRVALEEAQTAALHVENTDCALSLQEEADAERASIREHLLWLGLAMSNLWSLEWLVILWSLVFLLIVPVLLLIGADIFVSQA